MVCEKQATVLVSVKTLEISRSGYYAWKKRPACDRKKENAILIETIKEIHFDSRGTYGVPRVRSKLKELGESCGKGRIGTLMKKAGISGTIKRKFRINTTDSNHDSPIAPRIFQTEEITTHPTKPNQVWAGDITYIHTGEGVLYLATQLDIFTKKMVGHSMGEEMKSELILTALEMALGRQKLITAELVTHSDRGSQYASEVYRQKLKDLKITASMSRKGNCYDNAFAESFFATLKKELIYRENFKTRDEAKKAVFEFIEVWYNRNRIHSSIGYQTPIQFEESLAA